MPTTAAMNPDAAPMPIDSCNGVPYTGNCDDGVTIEYCDQGQVQVLTCDYGCYWVNDQYGWDCNAASTDTGF